MPVKKEDIEELFRKTEDVFNQLLLEYKIVAEIDRNSSVVTVSGVSDERLKKHIALIKKYIEEQRVAFGQYKEKKLISQKKPDELFVAYQKAIFLRQNLLIDAIKRMAPQKMSSIALNEEMLKLIKDDLVKAGLAVPTPLATPSLVVSARPTLTRTPEDAKKDLDSLKMQVEEFKKQLRMKRLGNLVSGVRNKAEDFLKPKKHGSRVGFPEKSRASKAKSKAIVSNRERPLPESLVAEEKSRIWKTRKYFLKNFVQKKAAQPLVTPVPENCPKIKFSIEPIEPKDAKPLLDNLRGLLFSELDGFGEYGGNPTIENRDLIDAVKKADKSVSKKIIVQDESKKDTKENIFVLKRAFGDQEPLAKICYSPVETAQGVLFNVSIYLLGDAEKLCTTGQDQGLAKGLAALLKDRWHAQSLLAFEHFPEDSKTVHALRDARWHAIPDATKASALAAAAVKASDVSAANDGEASLGSLESDESMETPSEFGSSKLEDVAESVLHKDEFEAVPLSGPAQDPELQSVSSLDSAVSAKIVTGNNITFSQKGESPIENALTEQYLYNLPIAPHPFFSDEAPLDPPSQLPLKPEEPLAASVVPDNTNEQDGPLEKSLQKKLPVPHTVVSPRGIPQASAGSVVEPAVHVPTAREDHINTARAFAMSSPAMFGDDIKSKKEKSVEIEMASLKPKTSGSDKKDIPIKRLGKSRLPVLETENTPKRRLGNIINRLKQSNPLKRKANYQAGLSHKEDVAQNTVIFSMPNDKLDKTKTDDSLTTSMAHVPSPSIVGTLRGFLYGFSRIFRSDTQKSGGDETASSRTVVTEPSRVIAGAEDDGPPREPLKITSEVEKLLDDREDMSPGSQGDAPASSSKGSEQGAPREGSGVAAAFANVTGILANMTASTRLVEDKEPKTKTFSFKTSKNIAADQSDVAVDDLDDWEAFSKKPGFFAKTAPESFNNLLKEAEETTKKSDKLATETETPSKNKKKKDHARERVLAMHKDLSVDKPTKDKPYQFNIKRGEDIIVTVEKHKKTKSDSADRDSLSVSATQQDPDEKVCELMLHDMWLAKRKDKDKTVLIEGCDHDLPLALRFYMGCIVRGLEPQFPENTEKLIESPDNTNLNKIYKALKENKVLYQDAVIALKKANAFKMPGLTKSARDKINEKQREALAEKKRIKGLLIRQKQLLQNPAMRGLLSDALPPAAATEAESLLWSPRGAEVLRPETPRQPNIDEREPFVPDAIETPRVPGKHHKSKPG